MKNKQQKLSIALLIVVIGIIFFFFSKKNDENIITKKQVENINITSALGGRDITLAGRIQSREQAQLASEISTKILTMNIKEGDFVKKGEVLIVLENINQRLAVKNAQVAVNSAQLQLQKLRNNNELNNSNSVLANVIRQQEKSIELAKNTYLNVGLRAYPENEEETTPAPLILGNYNCNKEGEYIIDVYGSNAASGASMNISGLENDRISLSTDYPVPIGNCGLEIIFPKDFRKNRTWIIPVPNIRSAEYRAAKKQYETILAGKDLAVKTNTVLAEDISAAKDALSQAQLRLEVAQIQLEKTKIRAPFEGQITKIFSDPGDLATAYIPLLEMTSPGFEIITNISNEFLPQLNIGDITSVNINNRMYKIELQNIIQQSQKGGQKIPLRFEFIDTLPENIFDGMFIEIPLYFEQDSVFFVETDFVGFAYNGPFVNCLGKEALVSIENENDKGYWVSFINEVCKEDILLPHLLENN